MTLSSTMVLVGIRRELRRIWRGAVWAPRRQGKKEYERSLRAGTCQASFICCSVGPTLCGPIDYSLPGSSVHGISQARALSELPFPPPGDISNPGIQLESPTWQVHSLHLSNQGSQHFYISSTGPYSHYHSHEQMKKVESQRGQMTHPRGKGWNLGSRGKMNLKRIQTKFKTQDDHHCLI